MRLNSSVLRFTFVALVSATAVLLSEQAGAQDRDPFERLFGNEAFGCATQSKYGCALLPSTVDNQIALLTGQQSLAVRFQAAEKAKISIRVQALTFSADEAGLRLAEVLKRKRAQGVRVQVITDLMGNPSPFDYAMYRDLREAGVQVLTGKSFWSGVFRENPILHPVLFNMRDHEKFWVVDAEDPVNGVAVTGGMNISNIYFAIGTKPEERYRDQDFTVRGPLVAKIAQAFDLNFAYNNRTDYNGQNEVKDASGKKQELKRPALDLAKVQQVSDAIAEEPKLDYFTARARLLHSRPVAHEHFITEAYDYLIDAAQSEIVLENLYFMPRTSIRLALLRAARRGVKIRIITNGPDSADPAITGWVARRFYAYFLRVNQEPEVLAKGGKIEIYEWNGAPAGYKTVHAKWASFDRRIVVIGSYNLDPRSDRFNAEEATMIDSKEIAEKIIGDFTEKDIPRSLPVFCGDHGEKVCEFASKAAPKINLKEFML